MWLARRPQATARSDAGGGATSASTIGLVLAFIGRYMMRRLPFILREVWAAQRNARLESAPICRNCRHTLFRDRWAPLRTQASSGLTQVASATNRLRPMPQHSTSRSSPTPESRMPLASPLQSIFEEGRNCRRVADADRVAFVVDGDDYFKMFMAAAERARQSIIVVAWDFNSNCRLVECDNKDPRGSGNI